MRYLRLTARSVVLGATRSDEHAVDPGVAAHLRVERRRQQRALPDRDDPTGGRSGLAPRASTSTPAPTDSTHGARMNTACTGASSPGEVRDPPRRSRPGGRRRCGAP